MPMPKTKRRLRYLLESGKMELQHPAAILFIYIGAKIMNAKPSKLIVNYNGARLSHTLKVRIELYVPETDQFIYHDNFEYYLASIPLLNETNLYLHYLEAQSNLGDLVLYSPLMYKQFRQLFVAMMNRKKLLAYGFDGDEFDIPRHQEFKRVEFKTMNGQYFKYITIQSFTYLESRDFIG